MKDVSLVKVSSSVPEVRLHLLVVVLKVSWHGGGWCSRGLGRGLECSAENRRWGRGEALWATDPDCLAELRDPGQEGLEHLRNTEDDMSIGEEDGLGM